MTPEELRQWLADSGWTIERLASELDVTRDAVQKWLAGKRKITRTTALALKGLAFVVRPTRPTRPGHYWAVLTDGSDGYWETEVTMGRDGVLKAGTLANDLLPISDVYFDEYHWAGPIPAPCQLTN